MKTEVNTFFQTLKKNYVQESQKMMTDATGFVVSTNSCYQ